MASFPIVNNIFLLMKKMYTGTQIIDIIIGAYKRKGHNLTGHNLTGHNLSALIISKCTEGKELQNKVKAKVALGSI